MGNGKSRNNVAAADETTKVNWNGNLKKHRFTDVCCLLIFLAFLVTWAVIGIISILQGDINKVAILKRINSILTIEHNLEIKLGRRT